MFPTKIVRNISREGWGGGSLPVCKCREKYLYAAFIRCGSSRHCLHHAPFVPFAAGGAFAAHGYVAGEADKHLHAGLRREVEEVGVAPAPPFLGPCQPRGRVHIEYAPRRGAVHVLRGAQGGEGNFGDRLGQGLREVAKGVHRQKPGGGPRRQPEATLRGRRV